MSNSDFSALENIEFDAVIDLYRAAPRRLREAAAGGAQVAVTKTGERLPDKPSHSHRNILRAGFQEAYLRQNYVSPSE